MAHARKEGAFGAADFLSSHELRFNFLVFQDAVGDTAEHPVHHVNENAAAEENTRDDQIRVPEKTDGKIPDQKQNQQDDRDIQYFIPAAPVFQVFDAAGKADKADDIVYHQQTTKDDHDKDHGRDHFGPPLKHREGSFQMKYLPVFSREKRRMAHALAFHIIISFSSVVFNYDMEDSAMSV